MLRDVYTKSLFEVRRGLLWWSVSLVLLNGLMGAVYPSIRGQTNFADLMKDYPEAFRSLFGLGEGVDYTTGVGYLQTELFSAMLPLVFIVYAIAAGARSLAGEEERKTVDLLLARPVSRGRVLADKALAALTCLGWLMLVSFGSLWAVALATGMHDVGLWPLLRASISITLLAVLFGGLALLIGAATGRRGLAIGIASAGAALAYLWNGLAPLASSLKDTTWLSPFQWAIRGGAVQIGPAWYDVIALAGFPLAFALLAAWAYQRRDITT